MSATRLELNLKAKPKATIPAAVSGAPFLPLQTGKKYVTKDGTVVTMGKLHNLGKFVMGEPMMYWYEVTKGNVAGFDLDHKWSIKGEYVELSPFDKMVQDWLGGKDVHFRSIYAEPTGPWSLFPKAMDVGGSPEHKTKYLKSYEKQFNWKELA